MNPETLLDGIRQMVQAGVAIRTLPGEADQEAAKTLYRDAEHKVLGQLQRLKNDLDHKEDHHYHGGMG